MIFQIELFKKAFRFLTVKSLNSARFGFMRRDFKERQ